MLDEDENKPVAKSGQRKRKAEQQSSGQRNRKPRQEQKLDQQSSKLDQLQVVQEELATPIVSHESDPTESTQIDTSPVDTSPVAPIASVETVPVAPIIQAVTVPAVTVPAETVQAEMIPVGFQTLANAYGDYTRKSFEQARFFFEKLAGVRSLDKAFELQADFVKQACETFIADSQKILELHRELARQRLVHLEGFVAKVTQTALIPRPI
jgi:hypothetical protein